jgi:predicted anti-sigma-YlaC factor YlaD
LESNLQREISCKEAARLLSKRRDAALPEHDVHMLAQHLSMCVNCRNFDQQIDVISKLARMFVAQSKAAIKK